MRRLLVFALLSLAITAAKGSEINWPAELQGIAAGQQSFLDRVPSLAAVANARQAQQLEQALAAALVVNTPATLKILKVIDAGQWPQMINSELVCSPPTEKSPAEVKAFYQRTRLALLSTDDGAMCLWILEASWEEWNADRARQSKRD